MRSLTKTCVVLIVLSMTALLVTLGAQDEQTGGRRGGAGSGTAPSLMSSAKTVNDRRRNIGTSKSEPALIK